MLLLRAAAGGAGIGGGAALAGSASTSVSDALLLRRDWTPATGFMRHAGGDSSRRGRTRQPHQLQTEAPAAAVAAALPPLRGTRALSGVMLLSAAGAPRVRLEEMSQGARSGAPELAAALPLLLGCWLPGGNAALLCVTGGRGHLRKPPLLLSPPPPLPPRERRRARLHATSAASISVAATVMAMRTPTMTAVLLLPAAGAIMWPHGVTSHISMYGDAGTKHHGCGIMPRGLRHELLARPLQQIIVWSERRAFRPFCHNAVGVQASLHADRHITHLWGTTAAKQTQALFWRAHSAHLVGKLPSFTTSEAVAVLPHARHCLPVTVEFAWPA
jgi:hypothetical protein